MRSFLSNTMGLAAAIMGMVGATGIVIMSIGLGVTTHWSCFAGVLLVAPWMAGMMVAMDYASELDRRW